VSNGPQETPLRVLGFAGSLRRGSYNKALIRAAAGLAPAGMAITAFEINDIPLYNADIDTEDQPPPVVAFKRAIEEADALLVATAEYNYGIPGVLKNAIDWASRPAYKSPLVAKPCAVLGASGGLGGTVRAQADVRRVLEACLARVLPHPDVAIRTARDHFDEQGRLTDERTEKAVRGLLVALGDWTRLLKAGTAALA
jgi:chromate reductase, NAD(P)H dehydrogenase (quinone)